MYTLISKKKTIKRHVEP